MPEGRPGREGAGSAPALDHRRRALRARRTGAVRVELSIEATRREPANDDAPPETGVRLNLAVRF